MIPESLRYRSHWASGSGARTEPGSGSASGPVEEFFVLAFLCYLTMNAVQGARLLLAARVARADPADPAVGDEEANG